jgi:hypothetical protein
MGLRVGVDMIEKKSLAAPAERINISSSFNDSHLRIAINELQDMKSERI